MMRAHTALLVLAASAIGASTAACTSDQALFALGTPGTSLTLSVESVSERGAYLDARVEGMHLAPFGPAVEIDRLVNEGDAVQDVLIAGRRVLENAEFRNFVFSMIPMGKLATIDDVVSAVLYLVSPAASMVTGHSLRVDGGWTAQ